MRFVNRKIIEKIRNLLKKKTRKINYFMCYNKNKEKQINRLSQREGKNSIKEREMFKKRLNF